MPLPETQTFNLDNIRVILAIHGANQYTKTSYPIRHGIYSEILGKDFFLHFNLSNEVIRASGLGRHWPHPSEWLKRTRGNDWIYYSTGGYTGVHETLGEYYLPNLPYDTNAIIGGNPLSEEPVRQILLNWHSLIPFPNPGASKKTQNLERFLYDTRSNTPAMLAHKAARLYDIIGGRVSVLPPDTRHVDYDVIPITICEGCLYKCRFCRIKSSKSFQEKSKHQIMEQILGLKALYGNDLINYNAVFLGEHDALNADAGLIEFAAKAAYREFNLKNAYMNDANLFMFGSVNAFLGKTSAFFDRLDRLPYQTYINIGLESADQKTLDYLGKPLRRQDVISAFKKMLEINRCYPSIEITANFIMDSDTPQGHYPSMVNLTREIVGKVTPKGAIYLSPLNINSPSRKTVFEFYRLKTLSRLPMFLYTIQRL